MAYFDNASTTYPKPYCVYDFMDSFYRSSGANAGRGNYKLAQSAGALIGDTRKKIQELLHCQAKQVVFEPTATIALNIIIQGIIEKGAVNIYISPFEHNAVTRTLHHFEEQEKIKITQLTVSKGMVYDLEKIRYQFDTVKPDFVIVSHASNVFGLIAPVEDIFALAKKYEAITLVDMAQTAGLVDLNVGLTTIDFAVFAGHKTLYGPTGISGFVMNPAVKFPAVIFGGTGYESANQDMPEDLPQKYEMGTQDIAGIAGLNAALGWSAQVTIDAIRKKEAENRKKLIDLLSRYSYIKIIGNYDSCNYVGIVSCIIEGISSDSAGPVFDRCGIAVRTGLQCAPLAHQFMGTFPAGTIRFSVNYFTTDKDFAELEQALDYIDSELYEAVFNRVIELDSDLKDFINAVRAIVPPQAREMDQLKYQVQEENLYARERVIQMYLRFAVRIALQRAETYDCEISDTIQEALIGLVTAVDKYDPDSSGPFGSYASLWILQNIGRAQATQRPAVYYPVHKKEGYFTMYPILKENGYLNFDIWTDPEVRRIIQDRLGCGIDQAEDIIRQSMPIESLDEIYEMFLKNIDVDEIQDDVFENIIENEIQPNVFQNINPDAFYWNDGIYEEIEQRALREILEKLMGELSEREQAVLIARYGFEDGVEKTLEEVGQTFGVTRERIRQIESKALRKLSHPTRIRELKDFL